MIDFSEPGGTTIYVRQTAVGNHVEYSTNQVNWSIVSSWNVQVTNTDTSSGNFLIIEFITDITFDTNVGGTSGYFNCNSSNIQFGSISLKEDGTRPIITIHGVTGYPGLIANGSSSGNGFSNIYVFNLDIRARGGSTLATNGGWIGQAYFGRHAQNNNIINCSSDGVIIDGGGGILGGYSGQGDNSANSSALFITGCSSSGASASESGGIIGSYAGNGGGSVICLSCYSTGSIGQSAGGIVGYGAADGSSFGGYVRAIQCYSTGQIGSTLGGPNAGGIFGASAGTSAQTEAEACYSQGAINGTNAGGIYGQGASGSAYAANCYSYYGTVSGSGIYGGSGGGTPVNCYAANGNWNDTAANSALYGVPSPVVGTTWVRPPGVATNQPYELNEMGYTPYTVENIVFEGVDESPILNQSYTQTISAGQQTNPAIRPGYSYVILQISGGAPASYGTITMNDDTGIISTTSSTAVGTYTITLRNTGSYNYTTFQLNINSFTPIGVICFPAGTPILTDQGQVPIENINTATNTIRNKKIEGIVKTKLNSDYLICFEKNALGHNVPCKKTIMSGNHMVYANGEMKKANEFLKMVHFNRIHKIKYNGEMMYNVLMEKHETMLVNNMVCETLDPANNVAKLHYHLKNMKYEKQKAIVDDFNLHEMTERSRRTRPGSALRLVGNPGYVQQGTLNRGIKRNMVYNVYI